MMGFNGQDPVILTMQGLLIGPGQIDLSPPQPYPQILVQPPQANRSNATQGSNKKKDVKVSQKNDKSSKKVANSLNQQSKSRLRVIQKQTYLYNDSTKKGNRSSFQIKTGTFVYITGKTVTKKSGNQWVEIKFHEANSYDSFVTGWVMSSSLREVADRK